MYYAQMRQFDTANGPGIRATLFVSGCTHQCKGCFNEDYKDFKYGKVWDTTAKETFLAYLENPLIKGVTILGGEPMDQIQDDALLALLTEINQTYEKNIWIYSGYTYEQIIGHPKRLKLLEQCHTLVDGLFINALKDFRLKFKGSSNQRIIDIQASLCQNQVILEEI